MIYRSQHFKRTRRALGALTDSRNVFDSLGFTIWEYFNPDAVRAEAEALGRDPNSVQIPEWGDIFGAAAEDTRDVLIEGRDEITSGVASIGSGSQKMVLGLAIAGAIVGVVYLSQKRGRR